MEGLKFMGVQRCSTVQKPELCRLVGHPCKGTAAAGVAALEASLVSEGLAA